MARNSKQIRSIAIRIVLMGISVILLIQCNVPRRALITLGSAKTDHESTYAEERNGRSSAESQRNPENRSGTAPAVYSSVRNTALDIGYLTVIDRETSLQWVPYHDNPTSMLRYQMDDQDYSKRLPRFEELIQLFDKVGSELRTKNNSEISNQSWLMSDGFYISSTETYSIDNKKHYRGIRWNPGSKDYSSVSLGPGDLVNILLIRQ